MPIDDLTERRVALRDQLLRAGPEHTDMTQWFATADGHPYADCMYEVHDAPQIDIEDCGTTACLAGHGALLMLPLVCQDPKDVADHFGLDEAVFDPCEWDCIQLAGTDGTFDDEVDRLLVADGHDLDAAPLGVLRRARWSTLITYIDGLVKA